MSSIAHRKLDPNNKDMTPILAGILAYQSGVVYANKSNTNCSSILPKFASRSKANFGFFSSRVWSENWDTTHWKTTLFFLLIKLFFFPSLKVTFQVVYYCSRKRFFWVFSPPYSMLPLPLSINAKFNEELAGDMKGMCKYQQKSRMVLYDVRCH